MRRISILKVSCALLLSPVALARSISKRADLPACAQPCFEAAVVAAGCAADDPPCICDNQDFYDSLMPCVLTVCGFADVSGLLNFGLDFCNRRGVNSVERLNAALQVDSESSSRSSIVPPSTAAPTSVLTPATSPDPSETYVYPTVVPSTPISSSEISSVVPSSFEAELPSTTLHSTPAPSAPPSQASSEAEAKPSTKTELPPGQFTVARSTPTKDSSSEVVVVQTAAPTLQTTLEVSTSAPESSSTQTVPIPDVPSSASAILGPRSILGSLALFLVTLVLVF